jgi:hypothetical protein
MPMSLFFKRAKCFVQEGTNNRGTKKFLAQPTNAPQPVPFWVAETKTFEHGITDGSIVNLTPPAQMPGYKAPAMADPQPDAADEGEQPVDPADDMDEQKDIPQAQFGAQPMTPVQQAPKVGGITANTRKK